MGKPTGSANYSLHEMHHMLDIVKRIFPQGKDHWMLDAEVDTVTDVINFRVSRGGRPAQEVDSDVDDEEFCELDTPEYADTDIIGSGRESVDGVGGNGKATGGGTDLSGLNLELADAAKVMTATNPIDSNANAIGKGELVLRRSFRNKSKPAPAKRTPKQEKPATTIGSAKMPAATSSVE
ncbi:hypothetical protein PInf_020378 [Phytophthora infestans]|nr:hypothetical protein PInf_020378 [Phytophthora infestans]